MYLKEIRHNPGLGMLSHVVQTRAMTIGGAAQPDLARQRIKRSMNVCAVQTVAGAGDEQMRGHRPMSPVAIASVDVFGEDVAGRAMQRDKPSLAELCAADGQHPCLEIDILELKITGFT